MKTSTASAVAERPASMRALAAVLDLLAEVYIEPHADVRDRAARLADDERLAAVGLEAVAASLRRLADAPVADLGVEYVRLFLHGRPLTAHPYESFYRGGLLADDTCLNDLEALLRAAGVEPDGHRVTPDHLGVELDLLALLLSGLADAEPDQCEAVSTLAKRLLGDHLDQFVAAFLARLRVLAPDAYHLAGSELLADAVAAAARLVPASPGRSDVGPFVDCGENRVHRPQTRH